LIDDFEDGNAQLPAIGGRQADWWLTTDESPEGMVSPLPGAMLPERIIGGRCGSLYALRMSGQGYAEWGAVMSANMRWVEGRGEVPLDFSAFRGVKFWARAGELNTATIRIGIHDQVSHPKGELCEPDSTEIGKQCFDAFGTDILPLGTEWRQYVIHFDRLAQRGFGVEGEALDPRQIYMIDFNAPQGTIFDFWLDDLWLFE
jgi:hypothetical protein